MRRQVVEIVGYKLAMQMGGRESWEEAKAYLVL